MSGRWDNPRWAKYSRFMRKIHPWCVACRGRSGLQVHHTWYSPSYRFRNWWPIWLVPPWVLMVLCQGCHAKITGMHHTPNYTVYTATRQFIGDAKFRRWRWMAKLPWFAIMALPVIGLAHAQVN